MTDISNSVGAAPRWLNIGLWVAQVLLAIVFGLAGVMKLSTPLDQLAGMMSWVADSPAWLVTFIGVAEALGALGIILPAVTRIQPWLTPLAALGFALIQVMAIGVHASYGETASSLPLNLVLLALAMFVAWGRYKSAPIAPRR